MLKKNQRNSGHTHWAWLVPILALAPMSLAAKGCSNAGTVGDDCPVAGDCMNGTAGTAGTSSGGGKTCGGLLGTGCDDGEFCKFAASAMCGAADQTGKCMAMPQGCTLEYAPVCGCDGKTYGNACAADAAGVSITGQGECGGGSGGASGGGGSSGGGGASPGGGVCGGITGKQCATNQYCDFAAATMCGSGDQQGTCKVKPQACPENFAPVCGCDGKTYPNACAANGSGVSVASNGACGSGGTSCGGRIGGTCAAGEYCLYQPADMCGRADASGTCTKIPKGACDAVFDPVCGCDGKTYGNDCEAQNAGASVDHTGACDGSGGSSCGGLLGAECKTGEFCDYTVAAMCGAGDQTGTCKAKPAGCTANVDTVCGCDGKTYSNACDANAAGTAVASKGACK